MKRLHYGRWLAVALLPGLMGCATFAVRPPTPAKDLPRVGLEEPPPGEHFYIMLFASQQTPLRIPRLSHSWATVIHVTEAADGKEQHIEHHTISWMPASLVIHPYYFHPVAPLNLNLHDTIGYALEKKERVSEWGPYECIPRLYVRFLVQKQFLESGSIGYQCTDNAGEAAHKGNACDCIHAITDFDPEYQRSRYPLLWFGESATRIVVARVHEAKVLIHPDKTHDWLNARLGLDQYPIVKRCDIDPGRLYHALSRLNRLLLTDADRGTSARGEGKDCLPAHAPPVVPGALEGVIAR